MNDFYNEWQPVSPQSCFSSISPPSSINSSENFNLTTSSFSHYSPKNDRVELGRQLSDSHLNWHHNRSPIVYKNYCIGNRRAKSPIKKSQRPIFSGLNKPPCPKTPRRKWKRHYKRSDSSDSELIQQIAITIPHSILEQNRRSESRNRSDEGFCASDEIPAEIMDFDDTKTDFMNATDKIYENLILQQRPVAIPTRPPPEVRQIPIEEDEPMIYGRLTALLLSNARSNQKTRCKISQTQAEIQSLLQIQARINLGVEDEWLFSRNCALFGHQVAAQLRETKQTSPANFQLQVKKLHKILYGLKKKNVLFGGLGSFIQKILKAI